MKNSIMSVSKQTYHQAQVSHHHSFLLHKILIIITLVMDNDDLEQYGGTTTASTLWCPQDNMFNGATSFNQPLLYCNWQSLSSVFENSSSSVCAGTITCGWGDDTCPPTPSPIPAPTPAPTANGGGGESETLWGTLFSFCSFSLTTSLTNNSTT